MANICSISLNLVFRNKKDKKAFNDAFQRKIDAADKRNEGVRIAQCKWLFDACINETGARTLAVHGSTRWCLEQEAMAEWTRYLKRMKVKAFTCGYEECGCQVFGEYSFDGTELWDKYLDDCHPVWNQTDTGEDDYFDAMDEALVEDGIVELVA